MSSKVNDFFETFRVDYEGIDLGANSDLLPPTLTIAIEEWLRHWDPRNLNHVARIWFKEPVCNHCQIIRKVVSDQLDAVSFLAKHRATVQRMTLQFGYDFIGQDLVSRKALVQIYEENIRISGLRIWDAVSYSFQPLR